MNFDPKSVDMVLYHGKCSDGICAALSAYLLLGDNAQYIPCNYGDADIPNIAGKYAVILDFSYDRKIIKNMRKVAKKLFVFDHHRTAEKRLINLDDCVFDMSHSGAYIAWNAFHPYEDIPELIKYVEDRDLYKWNLPDSREFSSYIDMLDFTFEDYLPLLREKEFLEARSKGKVILDFRTKFIDKLCKDAVRASFYGYDSLVMNSYIWISEISNKLLEKCDVSIVWYYDHMRKHSVVSLRSKNDIDVDVIAENFGGGGHPKSAGFRWKDDINNVFKN